MGYSSDWLFFRSIRKHGSRLGWKDAARYTRYLRAARAQWSATRVEDPAIAAAAAEFAAKRIASFFTEATQRAAMAIAAKLDAREQAGVQVWRAPTGEGCNRAYAGDLVADFPELEAFATGPLGDFLERHFQSHFDIFYATLYKSQNVGNKEFGSELWHSDGGPGTCVNVMLYLDATAPESGALEALAWPASLAIFAGERAALRAAFSRDRLKSMPKSERRDFLCNWYGEEIDRRFTDSVVQPVGRPGLTVPFANNTIHRGGRPNPSFSRRAIIFHCYPATTPFDWRAAAARGLGKTGGYPKDPGRMS